jgi:hypothetical protein
MSKIGRKPFEDVNEERIYRGKLLETDKDIRKKVSKHLWEIYENEKRAVGHLKAFLVLTSS